MHVATILAHPKKSQNDEWSFGVHVWVYSILRKKKDYRSYRHSPLTTYLCFKSNRAVMANDSNQIKTNQMEIFA